MFSTSRPMSLILVVLIAAIGLASCSQSWRRGPRTPYTGPLYQTPTLSSEQTDGSGRQPGEPPPTPSPREPVEVSRSTLEPPAGRNRTPTGTPPSSAPTSAANKSWSDVPPPTLNSSGGASLEDVARAVQASGQPCINVIRAERRGNNDWAVTCSGGERYRMIIDAFGRIDGVRRAS